MRRFPTVIAALSLVVAACGGSDTDLSSGTTADQALESIEATVGGSDTAPTDAPSEPAPFHAVAADAVVVSGSAACEFSDEGIGTDGEPGAFLVVCELDLSDPRVSGTERHDRFRFVTERGAGLVWLVEDATIVNADGSWRGYAQAAEDAAAIPSGEAHFVGEGAYEGLEFHYYFFHADLGAPAEVRGWISDGA